MMHAPAARIGKTTGARTRPADSEKLPPGARFHVASEIATGNQVKRKKKRRISSKAGLINRVGM
jgi:hypothetical protein